MKKIAFILMVILGFTACNYDFIEPEVVNIDPTDTISFQSEIIPIFTTNDKCTSCHKTGETAPDLSEANAYNSIMNDNLVVDGDAEGSKIYYYPAPSTSDHSWEKYSEEDAQKVLVWIEQGALNN